MRIVFLVEEASMKHVLESVLPQILPDNIEFIIIPHNGKSDLRKSIPIKLRGWNVPEDTFVIIQDQDASDCLELKREICELVQPYGKTVLVRIVCRELEAWYWGDLAAVSEAYHKDVTKLSSRSNYRVPDEIINPKDEFKKVFPLHQQITGAQNIAKYMQVDRNTSASFNCLISGLRRLIRAV